MLVVPAGPFEKSYVPQETAWYRSAVRDPSRTHVQAVAQNPHSGVFSVFTSKAIMQGTDNKTHPTACTVDSDCGNSSHPAVCTAGACSSAIVEGVLATEISITSWKDYMAQTLASGRYDCTGGKNYTCYHTLQGVNTSFACQQLCYVVNSASTVVYNSSTAWPEVNTTLSVPLGSVHGEVMRQLVHEKSMFTRHEVARRDGQCLVTKSYWPTFSYATSRALDYDGDLPYTERKGGIHPASVTGRSCSVMQAFYKLDVDTTTSHSGTLLGQCEFGTYEARVVEGTNLALIVLFDYASVLHHRSSASTPLPREFPCLMKNTLDTPSSHEFPKLPCPQYDTPPTPVEHSSDTCNDTFPPICG